MGCGFYNKRGSLSGDCRFLHRIWECWSELERVPEMESCVEKGGSVPVPAPNTRSVEATMMTMTTATLTECFLLVR